MSNTFKSIKIAIFYQGTDSYKSWLINVILLTCLRFFNTVSIEITISSKLVIYLLLGDLPHSEVPEL